MNCYNKFAKHYNDLMDCDYEQWSQFLLKLGCRGRGLDLACGTGNITFLLASAGNSMTGVDLSADMLTVAESKKTYMKNPMFLCQDMTKFSVFGEFDFVSCVCDGINYLSGADDVKKTFDQVFKALKPNGVFVFDISSQYKLTKVLGSNMFFEDNENLTYFWTNKLSKTKVEMNLTFFENNGKSYDRFDECHTQHIFTQQELESMLVSCGFSAVETFDGYCERSVKNDSHRIVFFAKKLG